MIPGVQRWHEVPTVGAFELAVTVAAAQQELLDARRAEVARDVDQARAGFERALAFVEGRPDDTEQMKLLRASALAGAARSGVADARRLAVRAFDGIAREKLDGPGLADLASVLDDAESGPVYSEAIGRGGAPAWAHSTVGDRALEAGDTERAARFFRGAVLAAPLDPGYRERYADALARSGHAEAARELAASAVVTWLGDERQHDHVRELAAQAVKLDPTEPVARLVLGDVLRILGELDESLSHLAVASEATEDPALLLNAQRAQARAFAAGGRRQDALKILENVLARDLAPDEVDPDDLVLAAELEELLSGEDAADETEAKYREALKYVSARRLDVLDAAVRHYLGRGRLNDAIRIIREAIEKLTAAGDLAPQLLVVHGELRVRAGEAGAPDDDLERAQTLGLPPAVAWATIGEIRAAEDDRAGAIAAYGKALEHEKDYRSYMKRGQVELELGDPERAIADFEQALTLEPDDAELQVSIAAARWRAGDIKGSQMAIESALQVLPENAELLALRGLARRHRNKLDKAAADLEQSVRADPSIGWPAAELLAILTDRGERERAAEIVRLVIEGGVPTVRTAAAELRDNGRPIEALALLDAYLESPSSRDARGDGRAVLLDLRGRVHAEHGDAAKAEDDFREALAIAPRYALARTRLAELLATTKRPGEAAEEARRARRHDPGSSDVAQASARVIATVEGIDAALAEVKAAIRQVGGDPELLLLRAELHAMADEPREALDVVTYVQRRWPSADSALAEGLARSALGDHARAVQLLERALKANEGDNAVRLRLVDSLIALGRADEALELTEAIGRDDPDFSYAAVMRALALEASGNASQAGALLEEVVEEHESFVWARQQLVRIANSVGHKDLAKRHLDVLVDEETLDPETARIAWVVGDSDLALEQLDRIDEAGAGTAEVWGLRAAILFDQQRYERAIEAATRGLELDPDEVLARLILADAYVALDLNHDALAALAPSSDEQVAQKRAEILFTLGEDDAALETVRDLLERLGGQADESLRIELADMLGWADHPERAAILLEPLLDQASGAALRSSGDVLSLIGEFELATNALEAARTLAPADASVDPGLAWAYANLDVPPVEKLTRSIDAALQRTPDDAWLLKAKADALLHQGEAEAAEARRIYDRVLERHIGSVTSARDRHSLAGWCCYRIGEYDLAVDHLLRAVSIETTRASGDRLDLALVWLVAGRETLAEAEYARSFEELRAATGDLRRHGLLRVGRVDINEALAAELVATEAAQRLATRIDDEVAGCRPALEQVGSFTKLVRRASKKAVTAGSATGLLQHALSAVRRGRPM